VRRAQATQPYTQKLAEIVAELAGAAGDLDHPLLQHHDRPAGKSLTLVITSNRGLCGAYNAGVLRASAKHLQAQQGESILEVVGKKGMAFFRFAGNPIAKAHTEFGDEPAYDAVETRAQRYIDGYVAGEYDAVHVSYTRFVSNAKQTPEVVQLLPLDNPAAEAPAAETKPGDAKKTNAVYEFSPDPATLLEALRPLTVKSRLFQFFNDAVVSEQIARMVAMKSATDNAGKMRRSLKRQFNRARQTQITTELSEIIGGAAALD